MKIPFDDLNPFDRAFFTAAFCTLDNDAINSDVADKLWKKLDPVNKKTLLYDLHNWRIEHEDILALAGTHEQNGNDLWLGQGGSDEGFWDRAYPLPLCIKLDRAAHEFGEYECVINVWGVFIE